jgi:hypothetical protein
MKPVPPPHVLTTEDHRKGGLAAQRKRASKRSMQDTAKALLGMKIGGKISFENWPELAKYIKPDMTVKEAILVSQTVKAVALMDTQAAVFVRDTAGEKPTEKVDMDANVITYVNVLKQATGEEM